MMVVGLSWAVQPQNESSYWTCKLLSTHAMGSVVSILCQQIVRFGVLEVTAVWIQWCTLSSLNIFVEKVQIHLESWLSASVDSPREISEPCVLWHYLSDGETTSCSHLSHLFFWYNWCVNSSMYITFSPWSHVCSVLWCSSVCNSLSSHLGGVWWLSPPHRLGVSACEPVPPALWVNFWQLFLKQRWCQRHECEEGWPAPDVSPSGPYSRCTQLGGCRRCVKL